MIRPVGSHPQALIQWMDRRQLSPAELARRLGFSKVYIYKIAAGERPISDGFVGRFARTYGWEEARQLFERLPLPAASREVSEHVR